MINRQDVLEHQIQELSYEINIPAIYIHQNNAMIPRILSPFFWGRKSVIPVGFAKSGQDLNIFAASHAGFTDLSSSLFPASLSANFFY
jgi:hypothetical protein